ncbi:MAG: alpha/beta fold hydrolase [Patescibacteria group bacterium]
MKRVIILHGWEGGSSDHWLPFVKTELEKLGYRVFVPDMPDTNSPVIEKWVNYLSDIVGEPNSETFFVGHSIGCQTILRYLENVETPVGGAVFVAGWFNLENLEDDDSKEIAKPWIENVIDINKIKKVLPKSTLVISDNDPYGAFEENKQKFEDLGSKIIVMHNAGHLTEDDGFIELAKVVEELHDMQ